uniref:FXYD domain-containing ion transport regulator n=1 Tax=Strongyloides venezuelensis TaxID=75913 RepID=A0A0K0FEW7_STRVS
MPAVHHGYHSTTTTLSTATDALVSGAFKKEMVASAMLAIQVTEYRRPLLEFFILMVLTAAYRRIKRRAKALKKRPCFHCGSVNYKEKNNVPGVPPSSPPSPSPVPTFSKVF